MQYRIEYILLRVAVFIVNLLPLWIINGITSGLAWLVWVIHPFRLPVAYDNLSNVFPEKDHSEKLQILQKAYHHFLYAAGLILVIHRKQISDKIAATRTSGLDILDAALSEGKGVILTTYHGCWFETYFAWFSRNHHPTTLIYQKQSNPLCDRYFISQRQRYGTHLEHVTSSEKLHIYESALNAHRILIVSLDQNYTDNGTPVTLFDKEFSCARGTALLHLRTGAPVLTSVYYLKGDTLHIDFERVELPDYSEINDINISEISNLSIKGYEKTIRAYPDQWFSLFHRLWKKSGYPARVKRSFTDIFS